MALGGELEDGLSFELNEWYPQAIRAGSSIQLEILIPFSPFNICKVIRQARGLLQQGCQYARISYDRRMTNLSL